MNILLEFSTINYRVWNSLAKRLKEAYPESRFAGILGIAPGAEQDIIQFLKSQKDVDYEFLILDHEITERALHGDIDFQALSEFEEGLDSKSLWRVISADRELGLNYMHGAIRPKTVLIESSSYENILKVFSGTLKELRKIFDEFRPDLFLPAIAMGGIGVLIYEKLCHEHGIPYIVPMNVRVKNYFAFASDVQLRFPQVDRTYHEVMKDGTHPRLDEATRLYEELMGELEDPQYFDRVNSRFNIAKFRSLGENLRWAGMLARAVAREVKAWHRTRAVRRIGDVRCYPDRWDILMHNISYRCRFVLQKRYVTSPRFGTPYNPDQKYIYYPLHINPEYSTQVQATMWMDQENLIEVLAKSIPAGWKVCVKEHPGTLVARVRPRSFYQTIERLPNVDLIPVDTDMHTVISRAQMVAVATGTSGWEGVLRGIPVISFADNTWDVLGLSRRCGDVETLSWEIHDEVRRIGTISPQERRRRLICYLAAVLEHSFEVSYPNEFAYIEMGTPEQYEICGREMAEALIRHLDVVKSPLGVA